MTLTINDVKNIIMMPEDEFLKTVMPAAGRKREAVFGKKLKVKSMAAYSNICKNNCLYCGMRSMNRSIKRYRISPDDVIALALEGLEKGFNRIFLISGEDMGYGFDNIVKIVSALGSRGMQISLALGEFTKAQYKELKDAGADEYVMKFEMSDPESFNRLNPSTDFRKRMDAIYAIKDTGMKLASGNIIDWPGQTDEELANDIMLMKELDISWAPVIPYLPALNTPLAEEGKRGSLLRLYKEIAALRLLMPEVDITAQQPGKDLRKGLSDPEGNLAAINAGANVLFFDIIPDPYIDSFRVVDNRNVKGPEHIYRICEESGFIMDTGREDLK